MNSDFATILVMVIVYAVILIGGYVWLSLALSRVFPKLGEEGWKAWVPVLREMTVFQLGGFSAAWVITFFLPFIGIIGAVVTCMALHQINRQLGKEIGFTVLAILAYPVWATIIGFGSTDRAAVAAPKRDTGYTPFNSLPAAGSVPPPPAPPAPFASSAPATPLSAATPPARPSALPPGGQIAYQVPTRASAQVGPPPGSAPAVAGPPAPAPRATPPAAPPAPPAPPVPPAVFSAGPPAPPAPPARPAPDSPPPLVAPESRNNPWSAPIAAPPPPPAFVQPLPGQDSAPPPPPAPTRPAPASVPVPPAPTPKITVVPIAFPTLVDESVAPEPEAEDFEDTVIVNRREELWALVPEGAEPIRLTKSVALLGRNPAVSADYADAQLIRLQDPARTVSKTHARLELVDGEWSIVDLASTNGVFLTEGAEVELESGVATPVTITFRLGELAFRFEREE